MRSMLLNALKAKRAAPYAGAHVEEGERKANGPQQRPCRELLRRALHRPAAVVDDVHEGAVDKGAVRDAANCWQRAVERHNGRHCILELAIHALGDDLVPQYALLQRARATVSRRGS